MENFIAKQAEIIQDQNERIVTLENLVKLGRIDRNDLEKSDYNKDDFDKTRKNKSKMESNRQNIHTLINLHKALQERKPQSKYVHISENIYFLKFL
jgi:hypothetical protein